MIYSRASEYAIRAFIRLAQAQPGEFIMTREIAAQSGVPAHFLAKILQQLARQGMLRSSKGPSGGFRLRLDPARISLLQIVAALDGLKDFERCIGGSAQCNDRADCGMHDSWKAVRSRIMEFLEGTSIADLAKALEDKRAARPRRGRRMAEKAAAARRD